MANKIYTVFETAITFKNTGGTVAMNLRNLAAATGRVSAQLDRGAGSIATRYYLHVKLEKGVAGVVGEAVLVYVFTSDGTDIDGTVGSTDAALTTNQALDAFLVLPVIVNTTATNTAITQSFLVEIPSRYISMGLMNSTTGLLRDTDGSSLITLIPIADEVQ
jgi:hypothetical protein